MQRRVNPDLEALRRKSLEANLPRRATEASLQRRWMWTSSRPRRPVGGVFCLQGGYSPTNFSCPVGLGNIENDINVGPLVTLLLDEKTLWHYSQLVCDARLMLSLVPAGSRASRSRSKSRSPSKAKSPGNFLYKIIYLNAYSVFPSFYSKVLLKSSFKNELKKINILIGVS